VSTGKNDKNGNRQLVPGDLLRNRLAFNAESAHRLRMGLPNQPVMLSPEQVQELNRKLGELRHDVNNHLSLVVATAELIRRRPEMASRLSDALVEQPQKITADIRKFSAEFEKAFGITNP
jgi:hypothetical protein